MSELAIFNSEQFGELRSTIIDGEPWFVANDICKALDLDRTATRRLEDYEKDVCSIHTPGGEQELSVVNEPGLYSLVLGSRKPEAKRFKRWVTHDVIPSIRKTGMYATPATIENIIADPDSFIKILQELKNTQQENKALSTKVAIQNQQIAEMKPKATYYDIVLSCKDPISISEIAKDYGWSAKKMNGYLKEKGIQYKVGKKTKTWLLYQKYADKGYTKTVTSLVPDSYGEEHARMHTYWTQKGRLFIYDFMKAEGILPIMERNIENYDIDDIF